MKTNIIFTLALLLLQCAVSSCDPRKFGFGAGGNAYAEHLKLPCPGDSVINRLIALKSSGQFGHSASFADGLHSEDSSLYNFYFYAQEYNFLLHFDVIRHTPKYATIIMIGVKDFNKSTEWQLINRDISEEKQQQVLVWFDNRIRPSLKCF